MGQQQHLQAIKVDTANDGHEGSLIKQIPKTKTNMHSCTKGPISL